jgi:uncharacterized repeat protein (TIGR01451 family)
MKPSNLIKWGAAIALAAFAILGTIPMSAVSLAAARRAGTAPPPTIGPAGFAMEEPIAGDTTSPDVINTSYTHTPGSDSSKNLTGSSGDIMSSAAVYYVFWLGTGAGSTYEGSGAGDTQYENLLTRFATDLGAAPSQYHNLVTQYNGNEGTVGNTVSFGGQWIDTTNAYPHAGTTGDPLGDGDIQAEVHRAVAANGWSEDLNHIVAVFTATGIHECMGGGSPCTFSSSNGFCAYHTHFSDSGTDTLYAFMGFDNFTHAAGKTCVAGQTFGDNDPNRGNYPNGDVNADAEINTLSHELIEAETDPHPNDTWTGPNGEIGDACNFNFAPRNDTGADVYINGHPYIVQQEWSNAVSTCAIDQSTNGFCAGSVEPNKVCSPTTAYTKSVDNPNPQVNSQIHYTVTLNNTSDSGAETNLSATDTLPAGYTVNGLSAPGATSKSNTSTSVTVNYDTLPVHQSRTVTITASVPVQAGTTATNCGSLAGGDLLGTALLGQSTSPCAATTPVKIPTIVTYTGATTGDYHDKATVSATLTDASLNPLNGKTIDFTLNGTEHCSAPTNPSGIASCQITPSETAGPYTIKAAFSDHTDPVYDVSSTSTTYTVTKEETTMTYTGPTVILAGSGGATLTAKLVEDGSNDTDGDAGSPGPIPAETATLSLGSQNCTATTDASGNLSCTIPSVSVPLGPETVGASFAGDGYYLPSSASTTATVFAFPNRGAFVLGDKSTGSSTVTWWSDSWWLLNNLSGGTAPAAFKGFAGTITLPTTSPTTSCGSDWTTSGGDSPPPTSSVPSYMGVVVASSAAKSGRTISGNSISIVVVKVNPGYAPDPESAGTGTIVATFC